MKPQPGDVIKIKGEGKTGTVRSVVTDVHGVLLEQSVGGYRLWNLNEVRFLKHAKANGRVVTEAIRARLIESARKRWGRKKKLR